MRIAMIGSRELTKKEQYFEDVQPLFNICYDLACKGVVMTSGLCEEGLDGIAQKAYAKAVKQGLATRSQFEVYVAESKNITRSNLPMKTVARVRNPRLIKETEELAGRVHPAWDKCDDWARGMHSRNCHQILGYELDKPVDAVITWTPRAKVQGGTATAINIAKMYNVPIFNFGKDFEEVKRNFYEWYEGVI